MEFDQSLLQVAFTKAADSPSYFMGAQAYASFGYTCKRGRQGVIYAYIGGSFCLLSRKIKGEFRLVSCLHWARDYLKHNICAS
jgi:Uri superfamily endonuclease